MDPDANLQEQLGLANAIIENKNIDAMDAPDRLAELVVALHEWIAKGGFLPAPWKQPFEMSDELKDAIVNAPDGELLPVEPLRHELMKALADLIPAAELELASLDDHAEDNEESAAEAILLRAKIDRARALLGMEPNR